MLKGHPKGLFILSLANMGERFGYYTMIALFVLYLQAQFGFDSGQAGNIYGGFLFGVYFLPLLGGIIADRFLGYGKTITLGMVIMFVGYVVLALPLGASGVGFWTMIGALVLISLGTGLFKGNLQALVGNLYDAPEYSKYRDSAFSIFYMCINIGAFFAPSAAEYVSNLFLRKNGGFTYDAAIPHLAHQQLDGVLAGADLERFQTLASMQGVSNVTDAGSLSSFAQSYIDSLSTSYHYGFAVACGSLVLSMAVFLGFRSWYKHADETEKQKAKSGTDSNTIQLTPAQTRERLIALGLVFFVVMFFWMAFHQNGLCMTFFARDYTNLAVSPVTNLLFDLKGLLSIIAAVIGVVMMIGKFATKIRVLGAGLLVAGVFFTGYFYNSYADLNNVTPQKFQQFNPIFIVFLTPVVVSLFGWLNKRNSEPSAPKKIGIGMLVTALGFVGLMIASFALQSPKELNGGVSPDLVSPYWLINSYLILTVAELFLSPMGISFVSKVAPPQYKGLMQGGWLAATALGNMLVGVMGNVYKFVNLWVFWGILSACCLISAAFIFSIVKRLENATN